MMQQNIKNKIKDAFIISPKPIRDCIGTGVLSNNINAIQVAYNLTLEQVATLENNILLVFLGFSPISNLQKTLLEKLNLPENTILNILDDLASTIIKDDILQNLLSMEQFMKNEISSNVEIEKKDEPINIDKEIKETEAVLNSMNHIRTMSGDREVAKEAVHVSSQFDLFGLRSKKTEEKDDGVKWETDK